MSKHVPTRLSQRRRQRRRVRVDKTASVLALLGWPPEEQLSEEPWRDLVAWVAEQDSHLVRRAADQVELPEERLKAIRRLARGMR